MLWVIARSISAEAGAFHVLSDPGGTMAAAAGRSNISASANGDRAPVPTNFRPVAHFSG
jgi:hypothetical protein